MKTELYSQNTELSNPQQRRRLWQHYYKVVMPACV